MKRFIHISVYGLLALVMLAALACGGDSDTAPDESAPEPTAPLAQSVPTAEPSPAPTSTVEPTSTLGADTPASDLDTGPKPDNRSRA